MRQGVEINWMKSSDASKLVPRPIILASGETTKMRITHCSAQCLLGSGMVRVKTALTHAPRPRPIHRMSKSSPPRWVSPDVATTSKKPLSMLSSDTSNVPGEAPWNGVGYIPEYWSAGRTHHPTTHIEHFYQPKGEGRKRAVQITLPPLLGH